MSLTGSRDHEQAQGLGGEGGLLVVETLMLQDQEMRSSDHQKLLGSAQMETLHYLKHQENLTTGVNCQTSEQYFYTCPTYQDDW